MDHSCEQARCPWKEGRTIQKVGPDGNGRGLDDPLVDDHTIQPQRHSSEARLQCGQRAGQEKAQPDGSRALGPRIRRRPALVGSDRVSLPQRRTGLATAHGERCYDTVRSLVRCHGGNSDGRGQLQPPQRFSPGPSQKFVLFLALGQMSVFFPAHWQLQFLPQV